MRSERGHKMITANGDLKEFLTLQELKAYFGIEDDKTIRSWEQRGLKAIYLSQKQKYFYREDVRNFFLNIIQEGRS